MIPFIDVDKQGRLFLNEISIDGPKSGQIKVKVAASGVNRADLLQKQGLYPPPKGASPILGLEISGTVLEVGEGVEAFTAGDQVMGLLAGGGYASQVVEEDSLFTKIPKNIDVVEAAAIPEVFLTAYQTLFQLAGLQHGEVILIHAGASGVGTAAIQLAKSAGATVFTTVGTAQKAEACLKLGADLAIQYKTDDFEKVIAKHGGVDVVIDVVGGDYFSKNINILKTEGRYIVVAFMGGARTDIHLGKILSKRISIQGTTLRSRSLLYKKNLIEAFESRFKKALINCEIQPVIDSIYPIESANDAHDYMSSNQNIGKILLSWG